MIKLIYSIQHSQPDRNITPTEKTSKCKCGVSVRVHMTKVSHSFLISVIISVVVDDKLYSPLFSFSVEKALNDESATQK